MGGAGLRNDPLSSGGCNCSRNGRMATTGGFPTEKGCVDAISALRTGRRMWKIRMVDFTKFGDP